MAEEGGLKIRNAFLAGFPFEEPGWGAGADQVLLALQELPEEERGELTRLITSGTCWQARVAEVKRHLKRVESTLESFSPVRFVEALDRRDMHAEHRGREQRERRGGNYFGPGGDVRPQRPTSPSVPNSPDVSPLAEELARLGSELRELRQGLPDETLKEWRDALHQAVLLLVSRGDAKLE